MHEFYPYTNYLEHYGVKGMRWGVRKDEDSNGSRNLKRITSKDLTRDGTIDKKALDTAYEIYSYNASNIYKRITNKRRMDAYITGEEYHEPYGEEANAIWQQAYAEAAEGLNVESLELLTLYTILENAGIAQYFTIASKTSNGKKSYSFVHTKTGKSFNTVSAAKAYVKSEGSLSRKRNVKGKPVSVKKGKKISSTSVKPGYSR